MTRRRPLDLLRRAADATLDRHRQAIVEQEAAVEALAAAIARLTGEVEGEWAATTNDPNRMVLLPDYLQAQRGRRHRLAEDLTQARDELERRTEAAREAFLEMKRYELLIGRMDRAQAIAAARRETAFLDWLAGRRHDRGA